MRFLAVACALVLAGPVVMCLAGMPVAGAQSTTAQATTGSEDGQAMSTAESMALIERLDRLEAAVSGLRGGVSDSERQPAESVPFDALTQRIDAIEQAVRDLAARVDGLARSMTIGEGGAHDATSGVRGAPPSPFGQLPADATGQPLNLLSPDVSAAQQSAVPTETPVLAAAPPEAPRDHYDAAYGLLLQGNYDGAEASFREFLQRHPGSEFAGNAAFWIGETLFLRDRYADAARTFLDVSQRYPDGPKAAESLLKLGLSLTALGQSDAACSSYRELLQRYPDAPRDVVDRAEREFHGSGC